MGYQRAGMHDSRIEIIDHTCISHRNLGFENISHAIVSQIGVQFL